MAKRKSTGISASTDSTLVSLTRAYVLYDKATGEILYVHRSVSFPKSPPGREKPEVRARRLAGKSSAKAGIVEVDPNQINQRKPVRIDVATGRLVASKG